MAVLFALFVLIHGLIHLMGVAKAIWPSSLPQLTQPISHAVAMVWLAAALLFVATAATILVSSRAWWWLGLAGIVLSSLAIATSWQDAKAGAPANVVIAAGVMFGFLANGPFSLRAAYERDVNAGLTRAALDGVLREEDLADLPAPVQRYLRISGAIGRPRIRNVRIRMHGRIRSGPSAKWITMTAEQYTFAAPPTRLFYFSGSMSGIPVQGYHRYVGADASMRVKAAALFTVAEASGPLMLRSETVTMLNDICLVAPGLLADPSLSWEPVNDRTARVVYTNAGQKVRAELVFNDAGELTNFWSDDRLQAASGGEMRAMRWSTPVRSYRQFGSHRLPASGEARWLDSSGDYAYIELAFDEIEYNVDGSRKQSD